MSEVWSDYETSGWVYVCWVGDDAGLEDERVVEVVFLETGRYEEGIGIGEYGACCVWVGGDGK